MPWGERNVSAWAGREDLHLNLDGEILSPRQLVLMVNPSATFTGNPLHPEVPDLCAHLQKEYSVSR